MKLNEVDTKAGLEKAFQIAKDNADKPRDFRMTRPQLSIPPTQQELEQAFQQLSTMCDAYETMLEMKNERIKELEATLAMYEGKD